MGWILPMIASIGAAATGAAATGAAATGAAATGAAATGAAATGAAATGAAATGAAATGAAATGAAKAGTKTLADSALSTLKKGYSKTADWAKTKVSPETADHIDSFSSGLTDGIKNGDDVFVNHADGTTDWSRTLAKSAGALTRQRLKKRLAEHYESDGKADLAMAYYSRLSQQKDH